MVPFDLNMATLNFPKWSLGGANPVFSGIVPASASDIPIVIQFHYESPGSVVAEVFAMILDISLVHPHWLSFMQDFLLDGFLPASSCSEC